MDKVFEKTRELAMAIMESEAYRTMYEAEQAAMRNPMAASLMSDYLEAKGAVETVLQENDPDPAQLKALSEKMESCQEKLNMLDEVIALSQAREEFSGLISQVNQLLRFIITGQMDEGECSGSCSSCSGCH